MELEKDSSLRLEAVTAALQKLLDRFLGGSRTWMQALEEVDSLAEKIELGNVQPEAGWDGEWRDEQQQDPAVEQYQSVLGLLFEQLAAHVEEAACAAYLPQAAAAELQGHACKLVATFENLQYWWRPGDSSVEAGTSPQRSILRSLLFAEDSLACCLGSTCGENAEHVTFPRFLNEPWRLSLVHTMAVEQPGDGILAALLRIINVWLERAHNQLGEPLGIAPTAADWHLNLNSLPTAPTCLEALAHVGGMLNQLVDLIQSDYWVLLKVAAQEPLCTTVAQQRMFSECHKVMDLLFHHAPLRQLSQHFTLAVPAFLQGYVKFYAEYVAYTSTGSVPPDLLARHLQEASSCCKVLTRIIDAYSVAEPAPAMAAADTATSKSASVGLDINYGVKVVEALSALLCHAHLDTLICSLAACPLRPAALHQLLSQDGLLQLVVAVARLLGKRAAVVRMLAVQFEPRVLGEGQHVTQQFDLEQTWCLGVVGRLAVLSTLELEARVPSVPTQFLSSLQAIMSDLAASLVKSLTAHPLDEGIRGIECRFNALQAAASLEAILVKRCAKVTATRTAGVKDAGYIPFVLLPELVATLKGMLAANSSNMVAKSLPWHCARELVKSMEGARLLECAVSFGLGSLLSIVIEGYQVSGSLDDLSKLVFTSHLTARRIPVWC